MLPHGCIATVARASVELFQRANLNCLQMIKVTHSTVNINFADDCKGVNSRVFDLQEDLEMTPTEKILCPRVQSSFDPLGNTQIRKYIKYSNHHLHRLHRKSTPPHNTSGLRAFFSMLYCFF